MNKSSIFNSAITFIIAIIISLGLNENCYSQTNDSINISFLQATKLFEGEKYSKAKQLLIQQLNDLEQIEHWEDWWKSLYMIFDCDYYLANNFLATSNLFEQKHNLISNLSKKDIVSYYRTHAYMLHSCGDIQASIDKEENAIRYLKDLKDTLGLIKACSNVSVYHASSNDHKSAIKYGKEVLKLLGENDVESKISMLKKIAEYQYFANEITQAKQQIIELEKLEPISDANTIILKAKIAYAEKNYQLGIGILKDAEKIVLNDKNRIITSLNKCRSLKDSLCIKYLNSKIGESLETLHDINSMNAELHFKIEDFHNSKIFFDKSLSYLKTKNNTRNFAKELFRYSSLQLQLGNVEEALGLTHQVLNFFCNEFKSQNNFSLPKSSQLIGDIWVVESLYQKAKIFNLMLKRGELPATQSHLINEAYDKAIYCLDLIRENYINDESKYNLTSTMSTMFDDAFEYNFQKFKKTGSSTDLEKLFELSQLKKAFVFKSSVSLRNAMLDSGVPKDLTDKYFSIKYEVNLSDHRISDKVDSLKSLENFMLDNYQSLKRIFVSSPLTISQVQVNMNTNQAILHFIQPNQNELYCIAINKNAATIFHQELPPDFDNLLKFYNDILLGNIEYQTEIEDQFIYTANKIYNYTIKQVDENFDENIDQICIIPDGDIHNISFDNLFFKLSDSWTNTNSTLLSKYSISYFYHTNQIETQTQERKNISNKIVVGYDYNVQDLGIENNKKIYFQELNYVNKEIQSIAKILNCNEKKKISETELKSLLKESDLFHFAGHAWSDSTIQNSFLAIQENEYPNIDSLSYKEIVSLNLNTKLVTLSACRTNLGQKINSEGILSLSRAFTESGVQATLGSSWDAPDKISQKILSLFYQNLKEGMNKSKALQKAKLAWLSDDHSRPYERSPANWSNWRLYGDLSPLHFKYSPHKIIWPICAAGLIILGFFFRKKMTLKSHN